jgi:hypothetical protein
MHYVLRELQKNAGRAIEDSGRKEGQLEVTASLQGDHFILNLTDDGKGLAAIDPKMSLAQIKEWIFEEGTSTKDDEDEQMMDIGMGLYEVRRFIERGIGNGAAITALDNKQDLGLKQGVTFRIEIPLELHREAYVRDQAMRAMNPGGIDLTKVKVDSRLRGNDNRMVGNDSGIKFHIDPAQLAQWKNASGFVPVIISMQPLGNLRKFLGCDAP